MKSRKRTRRISAFFAALAVFCIFCFSCFPCFAETSSVMIDYKFGFNESDLFSKRYLAPLGTYDSLISVVNTYVSIDISANTVYELKAVYSYVSGGSRRYTSARWYYNGSELSTYSSSPTLIDFSSNMVFLCQNTYSGSSVTYYVKFVNFPTPTPAPTATPVPATPTPSDYNDTQFWNRVSNDANGAWNALTSIYNGIANNTVLRNLAIYLPLFTLILGLLVYALTFGGDD